MKRCCILTLMAMLMLVGPALAADEGGNKPEENAPKPKADDVPTIDWGKAEDKAEGKANDVGLRDDYLELAKITDATEEQQKQLKADQDARETVLQKWDEKNADRIDRYKKAIADAKTEPERKRLEELFEKLMAQRSKLAEEHIDKSLQKLKPEQQHAYNGHRLWVAVQPEFTELGVIMGEDQVKQAEGICAEIAKKTRRNPAESPALRKRAFQKIGQDVLTREQKMVAAEAAAAKKRREKEKEDEDDDDDKKRRHW